MKILFVFGLYWSIVHSLNLKDLPNIPKGSRAEYYLSLQGGGYKYGYDTGTGIFAKQNANTANEVEGHFGYSLGNEQMNVKYTAGVAGFNPEVSIDIPTDELAQDSAKESEISNPSYNFSYSTEDSSRSESGDINGNVQGKYSYRDEGGEHGLSYNAGAETSETGSITTNENSKEFNVKQILPIALAWNNTSAIDNSFNFSYKTDISSRSESIDTNGNVEGKYAYTDEAGNHDLSYKAGDDMGFIVTGGNLAIPNGLINKNGSEEDLENPSSLNLRANGSDANLDFSGFESEDTNENIQEQFEYQNETEKPSLFHKAINNTKFEVTDENLAAKHEQSTSDVASKTNVKTPSIGENVSSLDGSYNFSYSNEDSSGNESRDSQDNVNGRYSYVNEADTHDVLHKSEARNFAVANDLANKDSKIQPEFEESQAFDEISNVREYIHPKLLIPFNGISVIKLLPVNENKTVGYILS